MEVIVAVILIAISAIGLLGSSEFARRIQSKLLREQEAYSFALDLAEDLKNDLAIGYASHPVGGPNTVVLPASNLATSFSGTRTYNITDASAIFALAANTVKQGDITVTWQEPDEGNRSKQLFFLYFAP